MTNVAEQARRAAYSAMKERTPDNPCLNGFKAFSQTDEDGCIQEIYSEELAEAARSSKSDVGMGWRTTPTFYCSRVGLEFGSMAPQKTSHLLKRACLPAIS